MKIFLGMLLCVIIILACNSNTRQIESTNVQTDTSRVDSLSSMPDTLLSGCYSLIAKRDTASFQVQVKDSSASGSLSYNLFEKDRNDGTFEGEITGDLLIGWYLFRSEGLMSVRQVAWQLHTNSLWPANGEIVVRNDSSFFKDPSKLKFDSTRAFVKTKCTI
ncbi:MAG TPA: hypothetical protein VFZ42_14140 [Chitinophagaceae bacterium]